MTRPSRRRREAEAWGVLRLAAREHRWLAGAHVAASLTAGLLESVILVLVAQVAARLVEGGTDVVVDAGPIHVRTTVGVVLAVAGACAAARLGLQVAVAYLPARIAADVQARLRGGLFEEFDRSAWSVQAEERDGHLQELVTSHVVQATQGLMQAGVLVTSALGFLALLISAMFLSVPVALFVIGVAWLLSLALRPLSRRGRRHAHELSTTSLAFAGGVSEAVRVAEEAQVFGVSAAQQSRVRDLVAADRSAFLKTKYTARLVQYLYQGLAIAVIVTGLAGLYWSGTGRIAVLGAVVLMLVRSASYGQQAYASYLMVVQTVPFLDRLSSAEARYRAAAAPLGHRRLDHVRRIACDRVHYAYARGADALADVSFDVVAGESVGIVGPSGAGKSTLVQILLRLREPTTGRYLVNGEPGSEVLRDDWCRLVACVPQDPSLVHGSVRDNIRFFRAIGDEAIERAARLAQIHDDVLSWPGGYDAVIGQRADAVSGGQRQRICLARALAGEPEVLVLDEPTSALDLRSESLVQDSLVALRGRVTLFVVSHRLSMLAVCDRVIVLSDGRIEALEPAALLRRRSAFYQGAVALAAGRSVMAVSHEEAGTPGTAPARYPDFFVVGHPKCGTTALYDMLGQHPQLFMSPVKEPRFFVSDDELRFPALRQRTREKYLQLFAGAAPGQRTGEASPQYLASRFAAGAIAAANPSARIVAILREPASFIRSLHHHYVRRGIDRAGDLEAAVAAGSSHPLWRHYEQRVHYVEQLERYRAVFPPDQVLVLIYDDYRSANVDTVRRVFRFLHVDEEHEVAPRDLNPAAGVRSRVAAVVWQRLMLGQGRASASLGRAARAAVPHRGRDAARALYRRANLTAPPAIDDALMARLRTQFAPEVRKISQYLGRDLTGLWGYPDG